MKAMLLSIADDTKNGFTSMSAIRGVKMSQVITELVEQWLKANEAPFAGESVGQETAIGEFVSDVIE